ncbi:MAG: glycosyltransferase [Gammaproteobacteria bacterium]|nr:glycosyltransferase [Gammaproteobacteria bacterium]
MRILMISDVYFPRVNGVSTSIQTFMHELERLGHEVRLIAPDYGPGQEPHANILRIPAGRVWFDPEDRMLKYSVAMRMRQHLMQQKFDLIHIQTPFVAHYLGVALSREFGIPCVESYHTYFEEYLFHYVPFLPKSWLRFAARYLTRLQCNAVHAVIVPSTAMQQVLTNYGVRKPLPIIPTGIELTRFKGGDGARFRQQHGIDPQRPVMVFIGRVAFEKNIEFLLQVVDTVRIRLPTILLIIAGEGPALETLKRAVRRMRLHSHVLFVGYLSRNDSLLDCYVAADIFVFASRTETQGLVLLEAMALGVPVVSTAQMGTRDILLAQRGALVAAEDIEHFSQAVIRIFNNALLRARLAREAMEYVKEWSALAMAHKLVDCYQQLLGQPPTPHPNLIATPPAQHRLSVRINPP